MAPIPDESQNNPADNDPNHSDSEELETPNHIIPPGHDFSSDEDGAFDSDGEGPANDGYMLLPQDPEEAQGVGEEDGDGDFVQPEAYPPPSALDAELLSTDSMIEVRGAGVDLSEAVAQGSVHPAFVANFPDNKVPVHLQIPDPPKMKKDDMLWNQTPPLAERLQFDSAHLSKVKSAMAGFQLPAANIPSWAQHIPEDQWKQQLVQRLNSPDAAEQDRLASLGKGKRQLAAVNTHKSSGKQAGSSTDWPGTEGT